MFCFRTRKLLVPYTEGALPPKTADAMARHLSRCAACSDELAAIQLAGQALRSAKTPAPEPVPDLWSRIEREIAAPAPVRAPSWQLRGLQLSGAAAAAALVLFAVIGVGKLGEVTSPVGLVHDGSPKTIHERGMAASAGPANVPTGEYAAPAGKRRVFHARPTGRRTMLSHVPTSPEPGPTQPVKGTGETVSPVSHDGLDFGGASAPAPPVGRYSTTKDGSDGTFAIGGSKFGAAASSDGTLERDMDASPSVPGAGFSDALTAAKPAAPAAAGAAESMDIDGRGAGARFADSSLSTGTSLASVEITSVDMLNDADTDTRVAALFLYP